MTSFRSLMILCFVVLALTLASCGSSGGGGSPAPTGGGATTEVHAAYRILDIDSGVTNDVEAIPGGIDDPKYRDTHALFARQQNGNYLGVHQVTKAQWKRLSQGETPWDQVETVPADIMTNALPGNDTEAYNLSPTVDAPGITSVATAITRYGSGKSINLRPATADDLVGAEKILERGLVRSVAAPDQAAGKTLLDDNGVSGRRTVDNESFALNGVRLALGTVAPLRSANASVASSGNPSAAITLDPNHPLELYKVTKVGSEIEWSPKTPWNYWRPGKEMSVIKPTPSNSAYKIISATVFPANCGIKVEGNKVLPNGKLTKWGIYKIKFCLGTGSGFKVTQTVVIRIKVHPPQGKVGEAYQIDGPVIGEFIGNSDYKNYTVSDAYIEDLSRKFPFLEYKKETHKINLKEGKSLFCGDGYWTGSNYHFLFAQELALDDVKDAPVHWHNTAKILKAGSLIAPIPGGYNINSVQGLRSVDYYMWGYPLSAGQRGGDGAERKDRSNETHAYNSDFSGMYTLKETRTNDRYAMDIQITMDRDNRQAVAAIASGVVVGWPTINGTFEKPDPTDRSGSGVVLLRHLTNGGQQWYSCYMHMTSLAPKDVGDVVEQGEFLGQISNVGLGPNGNNHLHFACYVPRTRLEGGVERMYLVSVDPRSAFTDGINTNAPFKIIVPPIEISARIGNGSFGCTLDPLTKIFTFNLPGEYNKKSTRIIFSGVLRRDPNDRTFDWDTFSGVGLGVGLKSDSASVSVRAGTTAVDLMRSLTQQTAITITVGGVEDSYGKWRIVISPEDAKPAYKFQDATKGVLYKASPPPLSGAGTTNILPVFRNHLTFSTSPLLRSPGDNAGTSSNDHWAAIPAVPFGLTMNSTTGVISGIPTGKLSSGPEIFTVSRQTADGQTYRTTASIQLVPTVINVTMVKGVPGSWTNPYAVNFPSGSRWTVKEGFLPPGVQMDPLNGNLSGTPAEGAQIHTRYCIITCGGADVQFKIKVLNAAFDPAGTQWSVAPVENGITRAYDPTPWTFETDGTLHADNLWSGTWAAPVSNTSRCVNASEGSYSFDVTFSADGASFLAYRDGVLFRTAKRIWSVPTITSPTTASVNLGDRFTYAITATNTPNSFSVTGLPTPLVFNAVTGVISGIPAQAGTFVLALTAKNGAGTGSSSLTISVVVPAHEVAYFPFDDSLIDASGNAHVAEASGPVAYAAGRFGRAVKFAGVDSPSHVRIANSADLKGGVTGLSISCWVRIDSLRGMDGWGSTSDLAAGALLAKSHDRTGFFAKYSGVAGGTGVYLGLGTWGGNNSGGVMESYNVGDWMHVALTAGQSGSAVWINGVKVGSNPNPFNFSIADTQDLFLGKFSDSWYPLNGAIDELRIYTGILSDGQIRALNETIPPANTPPTISAISGQSIASGLSSGAIAFSVNDNETPATQLSLTASTSQSSLLPITGIVFDGSDGNRTVTLTPVPGQTGSATVTITVADIGGLMTSSIFTVTVTSVSLSLDTTVSALSTDPLSTYSTFESVIATGDGKILLGGSRWSSSSDTGGLGLLRITQSDGVLDQSFDGDGRVLLAPGTGHHEITSLVLNGDGTMILGGSAVNNGTTYMLMTKLSASGAVDTTFGNAGYFTTAQGFHPGVIATKNLRTHTFLPEGKP